MPVRIDQAIEVRIVVQTSRNESFVAAVRLVVHIVTRLAGVFVQQPVEGGKRASGRQKVKPSATEKQLDLLTHFI